MFFKIVLPTYPCWMSSLSFATFLSSITVKDKTQSRRDVYAIVPQEQPSLMTGSMQRLITSLVSQTNSRKTHSQKRHSFIHTAFTYILQLFYGARRNRWDHTVLERISSALWSTLRRKGGTSHTTAVTSNADDVCMLHKDNTTVRRRAFWRRKLRLIWRSL